MKQQQSEIQRELNILERDIIRAQNETTQKEAEAASILEKMDEDLQKERSYFDGNAVRPRAPNRTPEQKAADDAAKKAKKTEKEERKRKR